jgi:signal transduction histidine kinase
LLHDAGNLIGAVGLYCDLLSMPHVLRPEHRHYADELRLLGERSAAMIEQLIERRIGEWGEASALLASSAQPQPQRPDAAPSASRSAKGALGLRPAVERCAGLLRGIAGKQAVQFLYGEAAALPVRVPADSVERILINLVRNAAAALAPIRGGIRIGVGLLPGNGDGIMRPWPFQRVRLTVEDSGRGMAPEEVQQLLAARALGSPRHGIGFHVVRELVEVSGGELSVMSQLGRGTRVEMEWPVAQPAEPMQHGLDALPAPRERRRAAWQS